MIATKLLRLSQLTTVLRGQDRGRVGLAKAFYPAGLRLGPVGSIVVLARTA